MIKKISLLSAILFYVIFSADAQLKQHTIDPPLTGSGIQTIHGPHYALYDPGVKHSGKLLLFIVGTNGKATDWLNFVQYAAHMGYNAISIDYKNTVITTACLESKDSACFDGFRQEIMYGTPVSELVAVDSLNSIYNRVYSLLHYLKNQYPSEGWGQFLHENQILWEKVVAAGHSQGAGHVVYLGKKYTLNRIIILAGPQDWLLNFHTPAPWLRLKSKTPLQRYYACLHTKDPYDFSRQLANCNVVMNNGPRDTAMVAKGMSPHTKQHILVTSVETANPHGAFQEEGFEKVWTFLLKSQ